MYVVCKGRKRKVRRLLVDDFVKYKKVKLSRYRHAGDEGESGSMKPARRVENNITTNFIEVGWSSTVC
jgi:hypothetical protein